MARSVAELLPRPFAEIDLDDVRAIIAAVGEERENLFFERKATISSNALAKACSAFANTYGGLLLVGIGDEDDALVGIEPLAAEAQLWVKDTLRSRVLPMPPFRARWLPVEGRRGVLLVLVEESAATPHLLTRSGAIYVRNPGSSDPVPIGDQRRLLDLTARGVRAAEAAQARAGLGLGASLADDDRVTESIALAATGVGSDFEARLFATETPDYISREMWGDWNERSREQRVAVWAQHRIGVRRIRAGIWYREIEGIAVLRGGAVAIYRGLSQSSPPQVEPDTPLETELRGHFNEAVRAGREILASYGAHGDLALAYQLQPAASRVYFDTRPNVGARPVEATPRVKLWTTFDDETLGDRVFAEIARYAGLGPQVESEG